MLDVRLNLVLALILPLSLAPLTLEPLAETDPAASAASDAPLAGPPLVVALDPGHGGTNLGASGLGRGIFEKNVTLALADRIRVLLEGSSEPRISVVLCRESDLMVPIRARARCAEDAGARLFISLHANAVPAGVRPGSQHGFEVFVLGPREVEDDATLATLARGRERGRFEKTSSARAQERPPSSVASQKDDAEAAWAAHEVRAAAEQSIVLARAIADALTDTLGENARRGIKQSGAALDVLRGTGTPAALVEVGFLDHPEEGARLATFPGREPVAQALAAAIRAYVHAAPTTPTLPHPTATRGGAAPPRVPLP
jgi:N-acetylmuramoyl-L-alanine amidase